MAGKNLSGEPGSITAFLSAWYYCLRMIKAHPEHTDLTLEFIQELHNRVTKDVTGKLKLSSLTGGELRKTTAHETFALISSCSYRYTEQGMKELLLALKDILPGAKLIARSSALCEAHTSSDKHCLGMIDSSNAYISFTNNDNEITWKMNQTSEPSKTNINAYLMQK